MEELNSYYQNACNTPSDIFEHIPTFRNYSKNLSSVCEFGVRTGVSTWGFLKGLSESHSQDKKYIGVDLCKLEEIAPAEQVCNKVGINYQFIQGDSAKVDIPEVDILFIDSWHIYGHLKRELENNHHKVKKYIMMHDTTVDQLLGENIRCGYDVLKASKDSGYPVCEIIVGLWPAVVEFLNNHPEWKLKERYTNNNGLTVLERIQN